MKKLIAMIAALTLVLSLAACADGQENDSAVSGTADSSSADTAVSSTAEESSTPESDTASSEEEKADQRIELSGDANDTFTAESDCYAENGSIVMYFQKGVTVRGDMLSIAQKALDELSETSGLDFTKHLETEVDRGFVLERYFEPGVFAGVDPDEQKVGVFVVDLGDKVAWADGSNAVLDSACFDFDDDAYATLYHELSHVLQFRNGVSLGGALNEGFAAYTDSRTRLEHGIAAWTAAQFYYPSDFDESLISDMKFVYVFEDYDTCYQYGFRLLTYLNEAYGDEIFSKLLAKATEAGFDPSYSEGDYEGSVKSNSEELLEIIKSVTADTVLADFKAWYEENWEARAQEYMDKVGSMSE